MRCAQASPKMIMPAHAPYESIKPSVIASVLPIAICMVNMEHSTESGGGFKPSTSPAAAIHTIPNARFNEGDEPANHTKRHTAASENHAARFLCPNILPPCSAAVPINERCIPDNARIWTRPALRKASVHAAGKKALSAASSASKSPPASPQLYSSRIKAKRKNARRRLNGEFQPRKTGCTGFA